MNVRPLIYRNEMYSETLGFYDEKKNKGMKQGYYPQFSLSFFNLVVAVFPNK